MARAPPPCPWWAAPARPRSCAPRGGGRPPGRFASCCWWGSRAPGRRVWPRRPSAAGAARRPEAVRPAWPQRRSVCGPRRSEPPAGLDPAAALPLRETAGAVAALARDGAAALLLDDVHHADLASWEVLALLARTHERASVLVLATAHRGALAARTDAAALAARLELDGALTRLEVPPLPRDDVAALAAARLGEEPPAALSEWLWELSGGRPLLAITVLDALVAEGGNVTSPVLGAHPRRWPRGSPRRPGTFPRRPATCSRPSPFWIAAPRRRRSRCCPAPAPTPPRARWRHSPPQG